MKRITEYRRLFGATEETSLAELKISYRNLMKTWHPDKFLEDNEAKMEAEAKSKSIIEAYHFLVSLSPETHLQEKESYDAIISTSTIIDFIYKGQLLKITFADGSEYEYFGVPKNVYNKFLNSPTRLRFARRHILESFPFRKATKAQEVATGA
ncbi:MAG: KTSC domain-containing protein [Cytophagales bacterium]|nr:KTSC domain-containing protein [Cytophagales bacterium]